MIKCDFCEFTTKYKSTLEKHIKIIHTKNAETYSCNQCDHTTKYKDHLNRHINTVHNNIMIKCGFCDFITKYKESLKNHIENMHTKNVESYCCDQCDFTTKYKEHLNRHNNTVHNNIMIKCDFCDFITTNIDSLKSHIKYIHTENIETYCCDQCNFTTKYKESLKNHIKNMHTKNENAQKYFCVQCDFITKYKKDIKRHIKYIHTENIKTYCCDQCNFTTKYKESLKNHIKIIHTKNTETYSCNQCNFITTKMKYLKNHIKIIHTENIKTYSCDYCSYITKYKDHLKRHLSNVHDIGDFLCEYCIKNVSKISSYTCFKTKITNKICKSCYKKATGFNDKKEEIMVNYLKDFPLIKEHISLIGSIIKGDSCNTKRKPDLLITSPDLNIIVECDEFQHKNYEKSCEESRMSEIIDELKTGKIVFIRWNPDNFKINNKTVTIKRELRLEKLKETILYIINNHKSIENPIHIYYMYYNDKSKIITDKFPKTIINF